MSDLMDSTPSLKRPLEEGVIDTTGAVLPQDSSTTQAEKLQNGTPIEVNGHHTDTPDFPQPESKRVKLDNGTESVSVDARKPDARDRQKGVALIKEEYLIKRTAPRKAEEPAATAPTDETKPAVVDDRDRPEEEKKEEKKGKKQKKEKGQNKGRQYGDWADAIRLCNSRANSSEFSPKECSFGDRCNLSHDLRKYLKEGRREDLTTFEGKCPVFEVNGRCHAGWKCRFVGSHSKEIEHDDGRKELILLVDPIKATTAEVDDGENRVGVHNVVSSLDKLNLARRVTKTPKSDQYNEWIEKDAREMDKTYHKKKDDGTETKAEHRATFIDPPFRPSEKRRIYFGPETPVLAPLTTQGNLPFRRLCVDLGAQLTYSEMAMAFPLIQGQKSEWALMKAHESEITPPLYTSKSNYIVQGYDNSKDLKFGAQIAANKPWHALKAAEILSTLVPHLREININCGCPIDLVYRQGAGSALLDTPSKLEKMVRGMNAVSGEVPITVKIRMGTKDDRPTANKLIQRMAFGGDETRDRLGAPGCAAITLHGRSRQQRYTRSANWSYIAECAALVKSFHDKESALTDTAAEPDAQHLANGGKMFLIGNGDCYSHVDYYDHINNAGVDSVMLARGALIKPWLFEEIEKGQYLDKSASERLAYVERFVRYGLEAWGSDEMGISATRRFLLEWLSFAHRYVPIGILEHLPPSLQDRPPAYRGRNELETLLASDNYKDWIKISEMFLGPVGAKFQFQPKHKSNSYETEIEG